MISTTSYRKTPFKIAFFEITLFIACFDFSSWKIYIERFLWSATVLPSWLFWIATVNILWGSYRSCSVIKGVLRNFAKFTGKHLCRSLLRLCRTLWHICFPVNFTKFLRTPFLEEHPRTTSSAFSKINK